MDELAQALSDLVGPRYLSNEDMPPTVQLRVGMVDKVYNGVSSLGPNQDPARTLGSLKVVWLDRISPSTQIIPWTYPIFSNPKINTVNGTTTQGTTTQQTSTTIGSSYGIAFIPSINDLVICGFRGDTTPVVLGFLPHNFFKQTLPTGDPGKDPSFGPFRSLVQGELDIWSQQQADIYFDRAGTLQLIVRAQPPAGGNPPIDTTKIPGIDTNELARISLGVTYSDAAFSQPILSSYGKQSICRIALSNGANIQIDATGNVDIQSSGSAHMGAPNDVSLGAGANLLTGALNTLMSTVNGMTLGATTYDLKTTGASTWEGQTVTINKGSEGAARMLDQTLSNPTTDAAFWAFIQTLVTTFNTHTHIYSPGPGGPEPSAPPLPLIVSSPTQQVGQINSGSSSVKIGN